MADILGTPGDDSIVGTSGNDVLQGVGGNDFIDGGDGNDTIYGGAGIDRIYGGKGNDVLMGFGGADVLDGGEGDDLVTLYFGEGAQAIGGPGTDTLALSFQNSKVPIVLDLTDMWRGRTGLVSGGGSVTGFERLFALAPNEPERDIDSAYVPNIGSPQADTIIIGAGYTGNFAFNTGDGDDNYVGGSGRDLILPGLGADFITGGLGADIIRGSLAELSGDRITDFSAGDRIRIFDNNYKPGNFSLVGRTITINGTTTIDVAETTRVRLVEQLNSAQYDPDRVPFPEFYDLVAVPNVPKSDFTGDGRTDLIFRNTNGAVSTWNFNATGVQQSAFNASIDRSWKISDTFDWNGDGRSDVLFRNDNGAVAIWNGNGSGLNQASYYHNPVSTAWRIAGTGDFTGDARDDILWQNNDGSISAWTSVRASGGDSFVENSYSHASPGAGWRVEGLADFNADGKADILWRNTASGGVATWMADDRGGFIDGGFYSAVANSWHIVGTGDFGGDGKDDILWRNDNGALTIWQSDGAGFANNAYSTTVAKSWHVAQIGDMDNDGKADIVWRNDSGAVSTWHGALSGFSNQTFRQSVYNSAAPTSWTIEAHDFWI